MGEICNCSRLQTYSDHRDFLIVLIDRDGSFELYVDILSESKWEDYKFSFGLLAVCCLSTSNKCWLCFILVICTSYKNQDVLKSCAVL